MRRHRSQGRLTAAVSLLAALLIMAGCGDDATSADPEPSKDASAPPAADTDLGEGTWLVAISSVGGTDAETSTTVYVSFDPSTGTATARKMPSVRAGTASGADAALLVSTDRAWAVPDTSIPRAQGRSGRVEVHSLTDDGSTTLDLRRLSGRDDLVPIAWAFDPQRPDTLRVVDTRDRVWAVAVSGGRASREGRLTQGPWFFTDGFDRNTGQPWVESIDSDETRPPGNGPDDTSAVRRAGGTVLPADSDQLAALPKHPCRLAGGFTDADKTSWVFCADKAGLTTHYLPSGEQEWTAYGEPGDPVAPVAADVPLVLPPVG